MISLILGENLFQQGISSFFATNKDGFINSDLWKLLTIAGHRSGALSMNVRFQDVVDSWVLTGFPVLVVDYNNNEEKVALHQVCSLFYFIKCFLFCMNVLSQKSCFSFFWIS